MKKSIALLSSILAICSTASAELSICLVDFGNTTSASPWNNITTSTSTWAIADLLNSDGSASGASLTFSYDGVSSILSSRSQGIAGGIIQDDYNWAGSATYDLLSVSPDLLSHPEQAGSSLTMVITGLTVGAVYEFAFFADRSAYSTYRPTDYTVVSGSESGMDWLNYTRNETFPYDIATVSLTCEGTATITIAASATNADGQYGVNVMQITQVVPEPSTYAAFAGLGVLGIAMARRRIRKA